MRKLVDWRQRWLLLLFDSNPCRECGKGAEGHEAVNVNGQPFARCLAGNRSTLAATLTAEREWSKGER